MSNIHTLPGRKFGTLIVMRRVRNERGNRARFVCICEKCSEENIRFAAELLTGKYEPCDCEKPTLAKVVKKVKPAKTTKPDPKLKNNKRRGD